jgi:hypothetical protein
MLEGSIEESWQSSPSRRPMARVRKILMSHDCAPRWQTCTHWTNLPSLAELRSHFASGVGQHLDRLL